MRHVRLRLRPRGRTFHPAYEVLTDRALVDGVEMLHWNADPGTMRATLLFLVTGDADRLRASLSALPEVHAVELSPVGDGAHYCYLRQETTPAELEFYELFTAEGLLLLPPLRYPDSGGVEVDVVGGADDLRALVADVPDGFGVEVDRVGDVRGGPTDALGTLSDRQREALRAGLAVGYYDVPRTGTVEDVAARLGCASSTASEHLRKAEAGLVRAALGRD